MSPGVMITQVAQGVGVLAGAWVIKSIMDAENDKPMAGGNSRCPTCSGTRRVQCICNRWSDEDVGCSTCGGTGQMRCNSCGGSGMGRPVPVQIQASSIPGGARSSKWEGS